MLLPIHQRSSMNAHISILPNNPDFIKVLNGLSQEEINQAFRVRKGVDVLSITQNPSGMFTAYFRDLIRPMQLRTQFRIFPRGKGTHRFELIGACNCGADQCPHAAATLLVLMEQHEQIRPKNSLPVRGISHGAQRLIELAKQLATQSAITSKTPGEAPKREFTPACAVVYCFDSHKVLIGTSSFLKRGGVSKKKRSHGSWSGALSCSRYGPAHRYDYEFS